MEWLMLPYLLPTETIKAVLQWEHGKQEWTEVVFFNYTLIVLANWSGLELSTFSHKIILFTTEDMINNMYQCCFHSQKVFWSINGIWVFVIFNTINDWIISIRLHGYSFKNDTLWKDLAPWKIYKGGKSRRRGWSITVVKSTLGDLKGQVGNILSWRNFSLGVNTDLIIINKC